MLLQGKNALVTGGSQGIGAAISLDLAREGANICLTYRKHEAEARDYEEQIRAMGRKALALATVEEVNEYVNKEMDHRFPDIFRFGRPLVANRVL